MESGVLNLMGLGCPMNFVAIKNALDRLEAGSRVEARLDAGPDAEDVTASLREGGYDVLSVKQESSAVVIVVRRRTAGSLRVDPSRRRRRDSGPCSQSNRRSRR